MQNKSFMINPFNNIKSRKIQDKTAYNMKEKNIKLENAQKL